MRRGICTLIPLISERLELSICGVKQERELSCRSSGLGSGGRRSPSSAVELPSQVKMDLAIFGGSLPRRTRSRPDNQPFTLRLIPVPTLTLLRYAA